MTLDFSLHNDVLRPSDSLANKATRRLSLILPLITSYLHMHLLSNSTGQHISIGINLLAFVAVPATSTAEDVAAAQRFNDFYLDYPAVMKRNAGSRIPAFTRLESRLVRGSFDFIGVNHYTTAYVKDSSSSLKSHLRDY
ncbi:hypothetical protein V2J09_016368 [Rumex salicifolius]